MIGKRFAYQSSHCNVPRTADRWFQNGRRVPKMATASVFATCPRLPRVRKWRRYGGTSLNGEFGPHRNALNLPLEKAVVQDYTSDIKPKATETFGLADYEDILDWIQSCAK